MHTCTRCMHKSGVIYTLWGEYFYNVVIIKCVLIYICVIYIFFRNICFYIHRVSKIVWFMEEFNFQIIKIEKRIIWYKMCLYKYMVIYLCFVFFKYIYVSISKYIYIFEYIGFEIMFMVKSLFFKLLDLKRK